MVLATSKSDAPAMPPTPTKVRSPLAIASTVGTPTLSDASIAHRKDLSASTDRLSQTASEIV
ncbi:unannotated protein [freshwater metagenome]|uniref:Unannotated protein n=1 Tax=freshwater metagenome TaxID=449393 RepID=A0A6J7PNJ4_9ZZZZ